MNNNPANTSPQPNTGQLRQSLSTSRIVFLVIAAAAPMAAVMGIVPTSLAVGNGAGVPLTFVIVTVILALFAVGYSAMSRHVLGAGAFYVYVTRGLGGVPGLGAAFLAVVSYGAFVPGALAYFSFFSHVAVADILGIDLPWPVYGAIGVAAIAFLGYRKIDLSSKVIAGLLIAEFGILLVLVGSIVVTKGADAFPAESLSFDALTSGAPGISIMLAFTCFIGFESAALYSEEARDPKRSIARATYIAVALIGVFYFITTWTTVGALGADSAAATAADQLGNLYFGLSSSYLSPLMTMVVEVFLATSLFATALAIHNAASRYVFALGRQHCLPARLGIVHPRHNSPYVASLAISTFTALAIMGSAVLGFDPMIGLGAACIGFGTVGIIALQALTSLSVIAYFRRAVRGTAWATIVAPGLAFIGLSSAVVMSVSRFDLLTGSDNVFMNALPFSLLVIFVLGCALAYRNKKSRPEVHARFLDETPGEALLPEAEPTH
jgi:amino acid transporter